jgi:hypothetical protein
MIEFLSELKKRNAILFRFGWLCLLGVLVCMILYQRDTGFFVAGVNAWLKPLKFFFSVAIFSWTIAWYLHYLGKPGKTKAYTWMVVIVMSFELFVITWQAANGRLSHFNISTALYAALFNAMGIAITVLTAWTAYIAYLFFKNKPTGLSATYLWGIRLGLIFFVIFSFEGGIMAQRLAHTVGNVDGSPGLPLLNWSRVYGDLRVAHFFGIHSLQVLPLVGHYLCTRKWQVLLFAALYFLFVVVLLVQALYKIPFIS